MNEREAYKMVDAEMEKYAKKRKHADMCVAFHERLVACCGDAADLLPECSIVAGDIRNLLVEIEKANQ